MDVSLWCTLARQGVSSTAGALTDLEDRGPDACVLEQVHEQCAVEVGHAEMADESFIDELLQCLPGLADWNFGVPDLAFAVVEPTCSCVSTDTTTMCSCRYLCVPGG